MTNHRPNLLLIVSDQHARFASSGHGWSALRTPNLDDLAERGVRFDRAYCANPVCVPSRMSMLSGRMPADLCGYRGEFDWPPEAVGGSLGRWLSRGGYHCAYAGKWHAPEPIELDAADAELFGFDALAGIDDRALPDACDRFFADPPKEPWLLMVNFDNPHGICEAGVEAQPPWNPRFDSDPEDWPPLPTNSQAKLDEPQPYVLRRRYADDYLLAGPFTSDRWRQYRYEYARMIELVDAGIGQILGSLMNRALTDDTVVIYLSDHGEMAGAHGHGHKQFLYEESVGVPLVLYDPRATSGGIRDERLINTGLDLLPTLCDYAEVEPPAALRGQSFRPDGETGLPREAVITETHLHGFAGRMVRTRRFKYVAFHKGRNREQLFDLQEDPGETMNLAPDPSHVEVLSAHRQRLANWCRETGDRFGEHYARPGFAVVPGHGFVSIEEGGSLP